MGTIAVTGSASGLGAAVRTLMEGDGHRVIGVDLHDADVTADLSTPDGRGVAVGGVLDRCDGALDGLVPCAGVGPHETPRLIAAVNYFGVVAMLDGLFGALARATPSATVAICSNSASIIPADPAYVDACIAGHEATALEAVERLHGIVAYGSSKVALARAVRRRVQQWGEAGVRINAVAPGPFASPLLEGSALDPLIAGALDTFPIPLGRVSTPEEIARVVALLLGADAAWIHGSILFVDGGTDALFNPDRL